MEYMNEQSMTNEKITKHKQYECPCCKKNKKKIGLHNKARHQRTTRHKDNLITVKAETKTEIQTETETEDTLNGNEESEIYKRM